MKYAKSILMGIGSVVLAGLILSLLAPKAVHAIAATAVQVMNTPATPVPNKDVDQPGRHLFAVNCRKQVNVGSGGLGECFMTPAIPAGSVFVIQHSDIWFWFSTGGRQFPPRAALVTDYNGDFKAYALPIEQDGEYLASDGSTRYVEGGQYIRCIVNAANPPYTPDLMVDCHASGYLISVP